jgi:hypothetical protein
MSIDLYKIEAIDPPGCGCMECIIGEYIPYDSFYIDEVLEAILDGKISPRNNLNDGTLIIYRMGGRVFSTIDSTMVRRSDFVIVPPNSVYLDEDDPDEKIVDISKLEDDYEDDEDKLKELISSVVDGSATASNPGDYTIIAYRSPYGETGLINLYSSIDEDEVAILLYDD